MRTGFARPGGGYAEDMPIPSGRARVAVAVAGAVVLLAAVSGRSGSLVHASDGRDRQHKAGAVSESVEAAVTCTFRQGGDDVVLAAGRATARGWWDEGNCPGQTAQVSVRLQARLDGDWHDIVWASTATVRPRDPAEATFHCQSAQETSWRSVVDVDLDGRSDGGGDLVTVPKKLACHPDL